MLLLLSACGLFGGGSGESAADSTSVVDEGSGTGDEETVTASESSSAESSSADEQAQGESIITESGLEVITIEEGTGEKPSSGDMVHVHYTGTLEDGTQFDGSAGGNPYAFPLGRGAVIAGWDEGIALLTKGSKAKLIIPPALGYGSSGAGGIIPPNAVLHFDVELVDIQPAPPPPPDSPQTVSASDYSETENGLKFFDFEEGDGASPEVGQIVSVHYTGWLTDGTMFDSSLGRGQPFAFPIGQGAVIAGWDEGIASMKVGGKRQLVIPPDLAYGEQGFGQIIPGDSTLIFEVELMDVQ